MHWSIAAWADRLIGNTPLRRPSVYPVADDGGGPPLPPPPAAPAPAPPPAAPVPAAPAAAAAASAWTSEAPISKAASDPTCRARKMTFVIGSSEYPEPIP